MIASQIGCRPDDICDFELQACDTQPSIVAGINKEFIFSGRLDNLCMSFCSLKVLVVLLEVRLNVHGRVSNFCFTECGAVFSY